MNSVMEWLGSEDSAHSYRELLFSIIKEFGSLDRFHTVSSDSEEENPVGLQVVGKNLGVITVSGSTISKTTNYSRYFGVASYQDIRERFVEASDDSNVKAILLRVDSGGGQAAGTSGLAKFISQVSSKVKPVFTHVEGQMGSAALWYGTAAKKVIADEDALSGSLGVIAIHMEYTEAMKQAGVTPTVMRTSPYKALGNPYEKLTKEARESIETELKAMHNTFVGAVAENRGMSPSQVQDTIATGKMYRTDEAIRLGIVDQKLSLDETVARLLKALDNSAAA